MSMIDIALIEDDEEPGTLLAHRTDCPVVQQHRITDRPIMTALGCKIPLPDEIKKHECLK